MTRSAVLTVSVDETAATVRIPVAVRGQLGVEDGDTLEIERGAKRRAVTTVEGDRSLNAEQIVLPTNTAAQLDVTGGESVTVSSANVSVAASVTVAPVPRLSIRGGEAMIRETIGRTTVVAGETMPASVFDGALEVPIRVVETTPAGPVFVSESTELRLEDGPAPIQGNDMVSPLPPAAVGGYESTRKALREAVASALTRDDSDGEPPISRAGFVLAGPHGIGKTHLLRHAAWQANATIARVGPQAVLGDGHDDVANTLHSVATTAQGSGYGIVNLDKFDVVLSNADEATVAVLRDWLERLRTVSGVTAVAEVTDRSALPVDFRQGGLLSKCITVPEPNREDRTAVLTTLAERSRTDEAIDLRTIGNRALGYVAADLVALWLTAAESAMARGDGTSHPVVTQSDLTAALERTDPSGIDSTDESTPDTTFDDIGGLAEAKQQLRRAIEWPLTSPELFEATGIHPPSGVLLYGPPGTGKTMLARAVAATSDANFISVNGPEIMNRYVGESERAVRQIFDRARANAPAVVFFDEIDAIGAARTDDEASRTTERVVSQLLTELDGLRPRNGVTVVGATNRPARLDDALLRPGRFDRVVEVPMPDVDAREQIFRVHLDPDVAGRLDVRALAERTDGYTGSDISAVVQEAGLLAIERALDARRPPTDGQAVRISSADFERALERISPSLSPEAQQRYVSLEIRD